MRREDYAGDLIDVYPDVEQAFLLFCSLSTQWRTSFNSYVGLDYNVLFHKLDRLNLSDDDYAQMESDISTLEREALKTINKPAK